MNIIFLGPQSSGKGTQAKLLSEKLTIPMLTTGDIFRKKRKEGDEEIASYIDKGMLVPDEVTDKIVNQELELGEYENGVILDGYPRNLSQAKTLDGYFNLDRVIFLDVPDGLVLKRIAGRRVCESCGAIFNINSNPSQKEGVCDKCDGNLIQRHDDKEEVIAKRLNIYHEQTEPLIDYYESQGKLIKIDGTGSIEDVWQTIKNNLK